VALKAFRADSRSGNLLFGAAKTGQTVKNFFAHCVATNMTERMAMPLRPVINKFREFSDFPLSLGVSDFAAITGEGEEIQKEEVKFPWVLCLSPAAELSGDVAGGGFEGFIEQIVSVKAGSHLYDIYACPQPQDAAAAGTLVKLGRIVTTTDFVPSSSDGLFFKHQRKEGEGTGRAVRAASRRTTGDEGLPQNAVPKMRRPKRGARNVTPNTRRPTRGAKLSLNRRLYLACAASDKNDRRRRTAPKRRE